MFCELQLKFSRAVRSAGYNDHYVQDNTSNL